MLNYVIYRSEQQKKKKISSCRAVLVGCCVWMISGRRFKIRLLFVQAVRRGLRVQQRRSSGFIFRGGLLLVVFLMIIIIILGARTSCDTAPKGVRSVSLAPRGAQGAFSAKSIFRPAAAPVETPSPPHSSHSLSRRVV